MSRFISAIQKEYDMLEQIQKSLDADIVTPHKIAFAVKKRSHQSYYYKTVHTSQGKTRHLYIGKSDSNKLQALVQSAYKKAMQDAIKRNLKLLSLLKGYDPINEQNIRSKLSPCVMNISPVNTYLPGIDDLMEWAAAPYEKNPRELPKTVIKAKDGTRVRSRVECIIYNSLLDAGIPFHYDPVLKFKIKNAYGEYEDVYESPDFQIKCPDGSYILLEHAGLLTSWQYSENITKKIQLYLLNGFTLGYSLFVTSDNVDGGIDSQEIGKVIELIKDHYIVL